jgi:lipoate---protein ligase
VVIGRNQNPWIECDLKKLKEGLDGNGTESGTGLKEIQVVRRRSGGGTVFHDYGNLNYSVIVPNNSKFSRALYPNLVVRALQQMDEQLNVKVNERNDIVIQRYGHWLKVSGSAFKLTRGRAMAHGTLLFGSPHLNSISSLLQSPGKSHIRAKGVESVRSAVGNVWTNTMGPRDLDTLAGKIIDSITQTWIQDYPSEQSASFQGRLVMEDIPSEVEEGRRELQSDEWRFQQTPAFDVTIEGSDGGGVQLKLEIKNGIVNTVYARYEGMPEDDSSQSILQSHLSSNLQGQKLFSIKHWSLQLGKDIEDDDFIVPEALVSRLELLFPPVNARNRSRKNTVGGTRQNRPAKTSI